MSNYHFDNLIDIYSLFLTTGDNTIQYNTTKEISRRLRASASAALKTGNFSFSGLSKKVRNVCRRGQKSNNELTHLHVGQKHPFTQEIRSLAQQG